MTYSARSYGDSFADVYDQWYADVSDVEATVAAISDLAAGGPVLELGVGSGRLAGPLAQHGAAVTGIDASRPMLDLLAANSEVNAVLADMAALPFRPRPHFAVVFVAFNTLFNLTSAEAQATCFAQAASVLQPYGRLVVEAFVPDIAALEDLAVLEDGTAGLEATVAPASVASDDTVMTSSIVDPDRQLIVGEHLQYEGDLVVRRRPWQLRYATPQQLDAMATSAGLVLAQRYEDWSATPFTNASDNHVSHYRPA